MNPEITTKSKKGQLIGRWSIFEVDCFDRDYLNLVAPATMTITDQGVTVILLLVPYKQALVLDMAELSYFLNGVVLMRWMKSLVKVMWS